MLEAYKLYHHYQQLFFKKAHFSFTLLLLLTVVYKLYVNKLLSNSDKHYKVYITIFFYVNYMWMSVDK
jgi:hypothetical protein